jgi:lipid-A-disaccharide synthase
MPNALLGIEMKPKLFMVIAGEPSGDLLAAELVKALRAELNQAQTQPSKDLQPLHANLEPRFFGAGGPRMAEAGVELAFDMTAHAVVGLIEVLKNYGKFRKLFDQLLQLALDREPDAIICVDFSGFNRRFAHAIAKRVRARQGPFHNWAPKLIQYVSPQVWASREGRAKQMAGDFDLLLSIFPFEQEWYAKYASQLKVEYVGHPMLDRYAGTGFEAEKRNHSEQPDGSRLPLVLLLPGSRAGELRRHLPVLQAASRIITSKQTVRFRMCLPNQSLADEAANCEWPADTTIQLGGLPEALSQAALAIASTGTVTMECAYFGVPTVALYKTSWSTYEIAKRLIKVNFLAMPNLLAGDAIYPEFIQHAADFLENESRRQATRLKLAKVIRMLGGPGASQRAARAIAALVSPDGMGGAK